MKIGIVTYHRARNYGAYLQAYALCSYLNREPWIDAEIIDFQMEREIERYAGKITMSTIRHPVRFWHDRVDGLSQKKLFDEALKKQILSEEYFATDSVEGFTEHIKGKYGAVIAGSDEIWKTNGFRGFPNPYWLIGDIGCPKLSYAASARSDFSKLPPADIDTIKETLRDYEFIGVRDVLTQEEVQKYCSPDQVVHLCCDPTLLYDFKPDKENGKQILKKRFGVNTEKKIIGVMTEDRKISRKIGKCLNKNKFELVSLYQWQPDCVNASLLNPFEWLDVVASLDLLCTSFFHAVIFASKFGIPLLVFGTRDKAAKVKEILTVVGREEDYYPSLLDVLGHSGNSKLIEDKLYMDKKCFVPNADMLNGYNELIGKLKKLANH